MTPLESFTACVAAPESVRSMAQQLVSRLRASPRDVWTMDMWTILRHLLEDEKHNRGIFNAPVDDKIVFGYYNVITNPMDLGTVRCRLEDKYYATMDEFAADIRLVFNNAMHYNLPEHWVHRGAKSLLAVFEEKFKQAKQKVLERLGESHTCVSCEGRTCSICSQKCLEYAHPEIRCSPPCKAKIPRNSTYYRIGGDRGQHWCMRCYSHLKDEFTGLLGQVLRKSELEQCVNSEVYRESWVKCPKCSSWSHEICSFDLQSLCGKSPFGASSNNDSSNEMGLACLLCTGHVAAWVRAPRCSPRSASLAAAEALHKAFPRSSPRPQVSPATAAAVFSENSTLSASGDTQLTSGSYPRADQVATPAQSPRSTRSPSPRLRESSPVPFPNSLSTYLVPFCAETLPRSEMGDFLEKRLRHSAMKELMRPPANLGASLLYPQFSHEEAERVADSIKVRVVSSVHVEGLMDARIRTWVQTQSRLVGRDNPLTQFPHRAKTICIFQESSPGDTQLAFALYVQEYGQDCPEDSVNRGSVYISYLDSVPYIQPRRLRTLCYKEVMLGYFAWVRARGFRTCYIWACPPQKGDAYVMHVHPLWHRNPSTERLRKWYNSIFKQARENKIVDGDTTLYDTHLAMYKPLVHTRRAVTTSSSQSSTATPTSAQTRFHLEGLPYFAGDYCQGELEVILAQLEMIESDLTQTRIRPWWQLVWGSNALVEAVEPSREDLDAFAAFSENDDSRLFDTKGFPRPGPYIVVKPSAATPSMETLAECEHQFCTVSERDEWIMRKISAAVKPQKDNFLVITFRGLEAGEEAAGGKRARLMEGGSALRQGEDSGDDVLPMSSLRADLSDPDPVLPRTCFDSRIGLLDLSIMQHLQFDTWRRARFSTAVLLGYLHRALSTSESVAAPLGS